MAEHDEDPRGPADEPLFAEGGRAPERTPRHRRPVFMTAVVTVVAAVAVAAWYGLGGSGGPGADGTVPVVRADPEPIKVQPTDPGGMAVPDQDKLVYDRMEGENDRPQVERLLPPPETPLEPPVARELAPTAPPPALPPVVPEPITEPGPVASAPSAAAEAPPPPPAAEPPAPAPSPAAPAASAGTLAPPPAPSPPAPAPSVPTASAAAGGYKVQLASVRTMEAAQAEWSRLFKRYGDVLGDLDLDVERADLGQRGVFFRVRGGPIATEGAAKSICDTLKTRDIGCLVVAP